MRTITTSIALALASLCVPSAASAAVLVVDGGGGAAYTTINSAISSASAGDTILVRSGTYNENVSMIGLTDVHLVAGETTAAIGAFNIGAFNVASSPVIIDGTGLFGNCLELSNVDHVTITGFQMQNCDSGIWSESVTNSTIEGNRIQQMNFAGYLEANGQNNTLSNNIIGLDG